MRQFKLAVIVLVATLVAPHVTSSPLGLKPAWAAELDLPIPDGYCSLPKLRFRQLMIKGGNAFAANNFDLRQLASFADCQKCDEWPSERPCSSGYGLYLENPGAAFLASLPRAEFLERMEQTFGIDQPPRVSVTAATLAPGEGAVSLGVLHRDDVATYVGYVHRDSRTDQAWISLMGYTVVRERLILLKLGAPYADETTVQELLGVQARNLQRIVEMN